MGDDRFVGARLRLAREFRGISLKDLAAALACTSGWIANVESGRRQPGTIAHDAFAEYLGFTPSFFTMPSTIWIGDEDCNFRSRRTTPQGTRARARARGTLFAQFVHALEDDVEIASYRVPRVSAVEDDEDAERAAERCRMELGLGLDAPIDNMIGVLEHCGAIVTRLSGTTTKIDAFSWRRTRGTVILSADKASSTRSRFDAAHEFGHLVMHEGHATAPEIDDERENQANAFARAFLLPRAGFVREFPRRAHDLGELVAALFEMKRRWRVSLKALLYRGRQLELVSAVMNQRVHKFISMNGWQRGEPYEPEIEEPTVIARALNIADARELAAALGWLPDTFEQVTGHAVPTLPPAEPIEGRVVDLRAARARRSPPS